MEPVEIQINRNTMPRTKPPRDKEVIDSDTKLLDDEWLYHWSDDPPREFCLHKTLFRTLSPVDIAASGWQVLTPAVTELASSLELTNVATKIDWLQLNRVRRDECQVGVHADKTVVAASPCGIVRQPFIPFRYFERLVQDRQWKGLVCACSFRHFQVRFQGQTFYTDRNHRLCDTEYTLHFGIHGVHSLWGTVRIEDRTLAVPGRIRVSGSLADLPGKVAWMSQLSQSFISRLGSTWLCEQDRQELWLLARSRLAAIRVPAFKLNELRKDQELTRCHTELDLILFLAKIFRTDTTISTSDMLKLSKTFFHKN